jgi:hypothetical protein
MHVMLQKASETSISTGYTLLVHVIIVLRTATSESN